MRALIAVALLAGCRPDDGPGIRRDDPRKPVEAVPTPTPQPFAVPTAIPLELPPRQPNAGATLRVAIDASGNVTVDGLPMKSDADIETAATKALAADPATGAVIRASSTAAHGRVIAVLDKLRAGGITRIGFSVDKAAAP